MDLYSIGEMLIDFIPGSEPGSYIRNAGGAVANAAIAFARNGLKAGLCCSVGDDDFGRFLMETLAENHVTPLRKEPCREAVTTMAFVTLGADGERSFTFARKPGADMFLCPEDVKESDIADSVIVHAGSCSLSASPSAEATLKALRLGWGWKKLVSFDVNYRDQMWKSAKDCMAKVHEALPSVDILKVSDEEAEMLGGEEAFWALMERYDIRAVVRTLGADGARCFFDGKVFGVPGRKAKCVDATGAGDAFWGGFLASLRLQGVTRAAELSEPALCRALEYGNIAGWLCVQQKGAISSLPYREETEKYL